MNAKYHLGIPLSVLKIFVEQNLKFDKYATCNPLFVEGYFLE